MDQIENVARFFASAVGVLLLWCSVCLHEDQEKKIHSRLEGWWIQADDLRRRALPAHVAVWKIAALRTESIFQRLFGLRVFTVRAASVSVFFSMASLIGYQFFITLPQVFEDIQSISDLLLPVIAVLSWGVISGIFVGIGLLPANRPRLSVITEILAFALLASGILLHGWLAGLFIQGSTGGAWEMSVLLLGVVGSDFLIVALTRALLKQVNVRHNWWSIVVACIIAIALPVMFIVIPTLYSESIADRLEPIARGIERLFDSSIFGAYVEGLFGFVDQTAIIVRAIGQSNYYSCFGSILFLTLGMLLAFHAIAWEAVQGALYSAQRFGIASRHKTIALIGIALLGLSSRRLGDILKTIAGFL
jgi:hypothetical protein